MADMEPGKISAEHKLSEELRVIAGFLDTELKPRAEAAAQSAARSAQWSWRKTIAFVLVTGLTGWAAILGLAWVLLRLLD